MSDEGPKGDKGVAGEQTHNHVSTLEPIQFIAGKTTRTYVVNRDVWYDMKDEIIEFLHSTSSPLAKLLINEVTRLSVLKDEAATYSHIKSTEVERVEHERLS